MKASANPAVVRQAVTFTATVQASAPGSGTPTGTVTFKDITTVLGTGTLTGSGQATFSTSALAVGTHAITASYGGDNNFTSSFSPNIAEVIKSSAKAPVAAASIHPDTVPLSAESPQGAGPLSPPKPPIFTAPIPGLAPGRVDNYFSLNVAPAPRHVPALQGKAPVRRLAGDDDLFATSL